MSFFCCNFLKILMVSDKMIYRAFRTRVTLSTKLIREIFHFLYLPKLYIGSNVYFQAIGNTLKVHVSINTFASTTDLHGVSSAGDFSD